MSSNFDIDKIFRERGTKPLNSYVYIFVLLISFAWCSCYSVENTLSPYLFTTYGKIFQFGSQNFLYEMVILLSVSVIYTLAFELIFYFYRYVIAFRVYSYIIPVDRFKADARLTYALRNFFFGIFTNLCFLYPYLQTFEIFVGLFFTMLTLILLALRINKTYGEPLVAHFVFKTFMYPIFLYEIVTMIFTLGGIF